MESEARTWEISEFDTSQGCKKKGKKMWVGMALVMTISVLTAGRFVCFLESIQNVRPSTVLDSKVQEGVLKARRKKHTGQTVSEGKGQLLMEFAWACHFHFKLCPNGALLTSPIIY